MSDVGPYFVQLLHECHDPDPRIRAHALGTLRKMYLAYVKADFLLLLLGKASLYEEQTTILNMIGQLGSRAPVAELQDLLLKRDTHNERFRVSVARTLAVLREHAPIDGLITILQDPTEEADLRIEIAELLGRFGTRVPLAVLLPLLSEADLALCVAGLQSLRAHIHHAPLEPIIALTTHPKWVVRVEAIALLSAARERAPIEPIVSALSDSDPRVREVAADGIDLLLEWFGTRVPLAPIITALGDEDADVRESTLYALANHPECAPLERVVAALGDQNPYIRCAALVLLERMGERVPKEVYPTLLEMAASETHINARKHAIKTLFVLKGMQPGKAHDSPGEKFTDT